jgi:hypothetical protein
VTGSPDSPLPSPHAATGAAGARESLPIRVITGSPTDEETAAIAALFSGLLLERAISSLPLPTQPVRSNWDRTRRSLRAPWPTERDWRDR